MTVSPTWWRPLRSSITLNDAFRRRTLLFFIATLAVMALGLSLAFAFVFGINVARDPMPVFGLVATSLLVGLFLLARKINPELASALLILLIYGIAVAYIAWLRGRSEPLDSSLYLLFPALMVVFFLSFRNAMIALGATAVWMWVSVQTQLVVAPITETLVLTGIFPFLGAVAYALSRERYAAETAAHEWKEATASVESILASTPDAVISLNAIAEPEFYNHEASDLIDYLTQGHDPARFWQRFPEDLRNQFENGFYQALGGHPTSFRFNHRMDGFSHDWDAAFNPHQDGDGVVLVLHDASDEILRQAEVEIATRKTQQRTLNLITHEINTPLTPILLSAHVLRQKFEAQGAEAEVEAMKTIERNVHRAIKMVSDLIELSRDESSDEGVATAKTRPGWSSADVQPSK